MLILRPCLEASDTIKDGAAACAQSRSPDLLQTLRSPHDTQSPLQAALLWSRPDFDNDHPASSKTPCSRVPLNTHTFPTNPQTLSFALQAHSALGTLIGALCITLLQHRPSPRSCAVNPAHQLTQFSPKPSLLTLQSAAPSDQPCRPTSFLRASLKQPARHRSIDC